MSVPTQSKPVRITATGRATDRFADPTVSFWVQVDGIQLPSFTACSGLSATRRPDEWPEAGNNEYVHQLPGRVSYTAVRLTRSVDRASGALAAWFSSMSDRSTPFRTATIIACDPAGKPYCHWDLVGVWPTAWTGPEFTSGGQTPATETLELVHHGFTFGYDASGRP